MVLSDYPNIQRTVLSIAACNGALNRSESQPRLERRAAYVLTSWLSAEELTTLDRWLATLTNDQREVLEDGEESEMRDVVALAPLDKTGNSLALIFNVAWEVL